MPKGVIGRYNAREYEVEVVGEIVYTAGNSPFDSQAYTLAEEGVGLATMKEYCEQTARDIAKEQHKRYLGVEYLESD